MIYKFPYSVASFAGHPFFSFSLIFLLWILTVLNQFQVNILKRVLEEVEKVMHEFKGTLYKSMEDPQIELTNVRLLYWLYIVVCC